MTSSCTNGHDTGHDKILDLPALPEGYRFQVYPGDEVGCWVVAIEQQRGWRFWRDGWRTLTEHITTSYTAGASTIRIRRLAASMALQLTRTLDLMGEDAALTRDLEERK